MTATEAPRPSVGPRLAAVASLLIAVVAMVAAALALRGDVVRTIALPLVVLILVAAGWAAATNTGTRAWVAAAVALGAVVVGLAIVLTAEGSGVWLVVVAVLAVASVVLARVAVDAVLATKDAVGSGTRVGPATRGAVIMNLKSGGGKAERFHLEDEARRRGLEPIVLQPGDDLLDLARGAIERGADVIGVAGGDGTQALVASVAKDADVAVVCIPAGTRNHFALDLGLDRDDVVGALDAFEQAIERRIDLATVNDRLFVNNVSLGVYAKIVQSPEYRDAKRRTTTQMLPELLGPDAEPFGLGFTDASGARHDAAQIVLVANNPYTFSLIGGFGTRAAIDGGVLGISTVEVHGPRQAAEAATAMTAGRPDRFSGWHDWSAAEFVVDAAHPVEAGVDGEAMTMDAPLTFRSLPGALRVRIPLHAPGSSPAARRSPSAWWTIGALFDIAAGRAPTRQ